MVEMGADVEIHAAASFVNLSKPVASHGKLARIQVLKVLGGAKLSRLGEGMATHIIFLNEFLFQIIRQLDESCACISEFGMASSALRREFHCSKEREASPAEVVARVGMEKLVALLRVNL